MRRSLFGLVWLVLASGVTAAEEPLSTDWGFFHSLALTRPGLEDVRDTVAHGDWRAARKAFTEYIRSRKTPIWFTNPHEHPTSPKPSTLVSRDRAIAEDALTHTFTVCGVPYQFSMKEIGWNFNPTQLASVGMAFNPEWTWQFNRHMHWMSLGRAYEDTGDERYVKEFVSEMLDWVHRNPVPRYAANQNTGSRWRTLEAGIRVSEPWPETFFLCLLSPSFTDEALVTMVRSMGEHARYLMAHPTSDNWITAEMNGLYTVGVLFPEFQEADTWRTFAAERLRKELDVQVYPDGAQKELAPGYHVVALRYFSDLVKLAHLNGGLPLPEGYVASLERMFDCVARLATPNFGLPPFNDSSTDENAVLAVMKTGRELFPGRPDFAWMASRGKEGSPPTPLSCGFPYAGYVVQRSGWDENARYLAFEGGPFGLRHQHEDKLSFVLMAYGREMVVEGGIYMYDASKWRRYVQGPYAHNVVFIDGEGQHREDAPDSYATDKPLPMVVRTGPWCDYVRASYGEPPEAFGENRNRPAVHTRRILFVKHGTDDPGTPGDFWVVADRLSPMDGERHRYEAVFHIDAPDVKTDAATHSVKTAFPEGPQLGIFPLPVAGLSVDVVSGQEEPVVQGWLPEHTKTRTGVRPIPTPIYRIEGSGVQRLLYVFVPVADGETPLVHVTPWNGETGPATAVEIAFEGGAHFRVAFPDAPNSPCILNTEPFQGEAFVEKVNSWRASIQ